MWVRPMKIDKHSKMGRFIEHVVPGVVRPMRVLWHEVIGFLFIVLAVIFGSSAVRMYHLLQTEQISMTAAGRVVLPAGPHGVFRDHVLP